MVLDYTTTCAACSTPMTEPPRDGPDSMCAHMHTAQGRAEFKTILDKNRVFKDIVDATPTVTPPANDETFGREVTLNEVTDEDEVTYVNMDEELVSETRAQRYRRLHKDEINQRQQDRRNHT